MAEHRLVKFNPPGPIAKQFMRSNAFIRSIIGPIGSGKSATCVVEILRRAQMQNVGPDGRRHSRWAVVRNTFPDLRNTTVKTWLDWVDPSAGKLTMTSPITHRITTDDLDLEVIFLALDVDADVRKLLSLELTGLFINESKFIPKSILDAATGRVGRYPSMRDGGCAWAGVIMDSNPPDTESWLYKLAEGVDPQLVADTLKLEEKMRQDGILLPGQRLMEFFRQPSGLSPEAENIQNLRKGYYQFASAGKSQDYIRVYIEGEYGFVVEGKPVYPQYRDSFHASPTPLEPLPGLPIIVGADFGLTPAAVFAQRTPSGRWLVLSELVTEDCGITRFSELLLAHKATHYPNNEIGLALGDPSGTTRGEDEEAVLTILANTTRWPWKPAPSNDLDLRIEAVTLPLNRLVDGLPAMLVSPTCATLRKGFAGSYHYKSVQSSNGAYSKETPHKNKYSHVHDACQYLFLGGGEYEVALGKTRAERRESVRIADGVGSDPFGQQPRDPGVKYSNAKTMRDWMDRRDKVSARIAPGTESDI